MHAGRRRREAGGESGAAAETELPRRSKRSGQAPSLGARALRLLARREHTRLELERKLAPYAEGPEALAALLDDLARRGWLSERRLVEQIVHTRRGKFGSLRIRRELLEKGVAEEVIAEALPQIVAGDLESARAVWKKKFGRAPRSVAERARQVRFMQGRGYALDTIMCMIKQGGDDD